MTPKWDEIIEVAMNDGGSWEAFRRDQYGVARWWSDDRMLEHRHIVTARTMLQSELDEHIARRLATGRQGVT